MPVDDREPRRFAAPEVVRAAPFFIYILLGPLEGKGFSGSEYWFYAVKTFAAGAALWALRPKLPELRFTLNPLAALAGVAVAGLWGWGDGRWPGLKEAIDWGTHQLGGAAPIQAAETLPWNPTAFYAAYPALGWSLALVRVVGRSSVVPAAEELFYRSLLYRMFIRADFETVSLGAFRLPQFALAVAAFGLAHPSQFLPALAAGATYQGLAIWRGKLGDSILAHATTNLALSIWTISTGQWQFS